MSTSASTPVTPSPAEEEIVLPEVTVVDRKAAVMFGVLTVGLALLLILAPQEGDTSFRLKAPNDFVELPTITVPSTPTAWVLTLACALCTAAAIVLYTQKRKTPIWLVIVFALAWMTGFLTWAAAGMFVLASAVQGWPSARPSISSFGLRPTWRARGTWVAS